LSPSRVPTPEKKKKNEVTESFYLTKKFLIAISNKSVYLMQTGIDCSVPISQRHFNSVLNDDVD
jgi:hypothetical protein